MKTDRFSVHCGSKKMKISKEVLLANSEYFRGMFDSGMTESQRGKLKLPVHHCELFGEKTLRKIFDFLKMLEKDLDPKRADKFRQKARAFYKNNDEMNSQYGRCRYAFGAWMKKATTDDVKSMLAAIGYFQVHGLMDLIGSSESGSMEHTTAVKVLPHALECGMERLHHRAFLFLSQNYVEFLRYTDAHPNAISRELRAEILTARCRKGGEKNDGICALYRTGIQFNENGAINCSYALVKFTPSIDDQAHLTNWSPEIVDDISTAADEQVVDVVTINNYLYLITSQYTSPNTNIRVYRYNPNFLKSEPKTEKKRTSNKLMDYTARQIYNLNNEDAIHSKNSSEPSRDRAWCVETAVLTKPGYVHGFRAVLATAFNGKHETTGSTCIFVLGAKRTAPANTKQRDIANTENLADVDCYDPIKNEWFSKAPVRVNDNINTGCCLNSLKKNRNFRITSKICLHSQTPEDGYIRVSALHSSENDRKGNFTLNRPSAIDDVHPSTGAINSDVTHLIYDPKNNSWETERRNNLRTAPTVNDGLQAPLPSRDIGNEAVRHSGGRIVASYRQGSSVFRLISDKTAKKGTDTVRLEVTRFQKTGQKSTDVIYRVPTSLATSDEQIVEYNPVDNILVNCQLAVPCLFTLHFPHSET